MKKYLLVLLIMATPFSTMTIPWYQRILALLYGAAMVTQSTYAADNIVYGVRTIQPSDDMPPELSNILSYELGIFHSTGHRCCYITNDHLGNTVAHCTQSKTEKASRQQLRKALFEILANDETIEP